MENIAENIWTHEDQMPLLGAPLRLRTTIVRLASGQLWVHSPTNLTDDLKTRVESLGAVGFIVGPNNAHNMWLKQWHGAFPAAKLYVSAGIPGKLKLNASEYETLNDDSASLWPEDFDFACMGNTPFFNEADFLHKPSRSLLVTDIIQNHNDPIPPGIPGIVTRCVLRPLGFKGHCTAPPLNMGFIIKDKAAFKAYVEKLRSWDFDRIIVTHGDIIEDNAKQTLLTLTEKFLK